MLRFKSSSPIPFKIPISKPPTILKPFFQFPPIQTHKFSYLQIKSRKGVNAQDKEDLKEDRVGLRWSGLLLSRDRDNVVAVGLTGVLSWASLQMVWQLFMATMATFIAGIKYTFIGILLIFIIITLL
ncbi:hypothetical protein OSB04_026818 [Centaurea solstitialis]|uniref:Transmembrane protein n=1 Tax=Centaurea solstitialis TaxID=347529 RepID=A0AA38SW45_9ASTR|nr:hypothetical protein OSB04_026818 [Centaurea solstitialis]